MNLKSFLSPAAGLVLLGCFSFASCSKKAESTTQPQLPPSPSAFPAGTNRSEVWDITLPATATSGAMEVTEWVSYQYGEINLGVTTSVDPGYVMVGGGAQVRDPNNTPNNVDAVLTAAYPVPDGNFATYAASDKDHGGIFYNSDLYVYVIGIKLFSQSGTVIPTSSITNNLAIISGTSGSAEHPFITLPVTSGYTLISGGAQDNYGTGYGNLLTENNYDDGASYAGGKDQKEPDPCTITAYALEWNNQPIPGYGSFLLTYQNGQAIVNQRLMSLSVGALGGCAVAGVGGVSTYTGYGRLLYGVYSPAYNVGEFQSKDQDVSDISGALGGVVTSIAPK
ncbi:hypothetical protein [Dinghuibacter silviterrae]|uniref:Lipoprotein n=1 Tax=Dinghuibacter silviterrae TaxID=1539049 RepID=A0A4R8DUN7_9BACT|nr:hypothetical protein [Dinghuibacter silviterrae]TDX01175.1 hypothetical protein EDB95_2206 [Dinghuibacter silviterrae]